MIGDDNVTGEEVAQRVDGDMRGVTMLLNALAAMGLLAKEGYRYTNTQASKSLLVEGSPQYIGYILMHHHFLVESWARLHEAVETGGPVRQRPHNDERRRESFLMGMFNLAMGLAPRVVSQIDLKDRHHLLDLGGGPGTYAIHFCLADPRLKATVYDLSTTRPFALRTIEQFDLADRIDFMVGNYVEDDIIRGDYDVAWLSHILHAEGPDECQGIIRKTVSALKPGGLILIHDFILDDTLDRPLFPALFALNMLLGTPHGRAYSESQIKNMLAKAGAKEIHRIPFQSPNDSGIIAGHV